jgi:hypothetical protein
MKAPDCPEHSNLIMDLARGRLDDRRAEDAETVRRDCAACAEWWGNIFVDEAVTGLDSAVSEAFKSFAPQRRRRFGWLAAAAAVVLAVGFGTTTLLRQTAEIASVGSAPESLSGAALSTLNFEGGDIQTDALKTPDMLTPGNQTIFKSGLESGDLSSWSSHSN